MNDENIEPVQLEIREEFQAKNGKENEMPLSQWQEYKKETLMDKINEVK